MSREERLRSAIWRLNVTAHGPTEIDLGHANLNDKNLVRMCPYLAKNAILLELNLQSNVFGDDGARALAKAMRRNTTLTKLDLKDNLITNEGCMGLISSLKGNTSLKILNIPGNQIGDQGIVDLARSLSDPDDESLEITTLRIGNNKFTTYGATELLKSISNKLTLSNKLFFLDISKCELTHKHGKILGQALETNYFLKTLILDYNSFSDQGVRLIAKGINANKANTKLKFLSLISNNIQDDGIASLLKYCSSILTHLLLSMNKASCHINTSIIETFEHLKSLHKQQPLSFSLLELDLSHNAIDDQIVVNQIKKFSELLDFQLFINGNIGNQTGLRFPNGIVKTFKAKKILRMKDDGETEEVIEYEEDNAEKELQLKNEKSYYRILNKTIKHATAIQEIRAEQLRRDPFDSKLIVSRRQGYAKHILLSSLSLSLSSIYI
mmetsp:Transcript_33064/g.42501  ORF Transcript_33064/g.42501 Transcript_33064/m.42501 type:complete len:439 (-) Transcript_33064:416-1732(-)